ncbi:MAG: hypothetical protein IKP66_04295 [Lachnospiraceae bacterium]|jgi:hypothetical protein|nr:hypothetical protein [Lachnospiraceae bacterium]
MKYTYFQPNDKDLKDKFGDCAVRALCLVENLSWDVAYDKMWWYSRDVWCPMNFKQGFDNVMANLGYTYVGISNKKGSKRPTVAEFAKTMKGKRAIAVVSNHYVGVKDGKYYDTWESGRTHLYGYWYKDTLEDTSSTSSSAISLTQEELTDCLTSIKEIFSHIDSKVETALSMALYSVDTLNIIHQNNVTEDQKAILKRIAESEV